jgi:DNA-binding LytR/AlgR family response regulator
MQVVLIEDELPAAQKLTRYLKQFNSNIVIAATLSSVASATIWLQKNQAQVDLILMDIQLQDGLSLEIAQQVKITKPVIFTTAYDEYALDAFKLNSVAYLLKPITYSALREALQKLEQLKEAFAHGQVLNKLASSFETRFKERFLVKMGQHIKSLPQQEVAYFFAEGRHVQLISTEGKTFFVDFKLEDLEGMVNPQQFFRINRSFLVGLNSIKDIVVYSGSRLKVISKIPSEKEMLVSREKVKEFKEWLEGR